MAVVIAESFTQRWGDASLTTLGFFWKAMWAFALGYLVSSLIQVVITKAQVRKAMGDSEPRGVAIGSLFGFISSSCSFAALSTTRALFAKGAALPAAMAFMLASTNLVIELGIVIAVFLSWQFVVGEYVGGLILILVVWGLIHLIHPTKTIQAARECVEASDGGDEDTMGWRDLLTSLDGWAKVGKKYVMEWQMVWKDVTVGFTIAGVIAVFVPTAFFQTLFVGSGSDDPAFWQVLAQSVIGPVAAFFTFIGSMGNIPLAALLYGSGVSFAGVMAFIFSDLVVLPVLRINAQYYGWKMALYLALLLLMGLVITSVVLHYGLSWTGQLPHIDAGQGRKDPAERFAIDYTCWLNVGFVLASAGVIAIGRWKGGGGHNHGHDHEHMNHGHDHQSHTHHDHDGGGDHADHHEHSHSDEGHDHDDQGHEGHDHGGHHHHGSSGVTEKVLFGLALLSASWLAVGLILALTTGGSGL